MMQIIEDKKMTPEQFVYWLQGLMELGEPKKLNEKQTQMIKDHLAQVFTKKTPDYSITTTDIVSTPTHTAFLPKPTHSPLCMCEICVKNLKTPTAVIC